MSIYLSITIYALINSFVAFFAFELYAGGLKLAAKCNFFLKIILSFVSYIGLAGFIVSCFAAFFEFIPELRENINADDFLFFLFVIVFVFSYIPSGILFHKRHMLRLKELGYFSKKKNKMGSRL